MKCNRLLTLFLSLSLCAGLCACSAQPSAPATTPTAPESDLAYIQDKGVLVVGITDFAPMDYQDANGEWIGFDADMARAVGEALGVQVEFVEITWDNKILELDAKSIDCVWNGMTLTDEVLEGMTCSNPYAKNAQVVVVHKDVAEQYTTEESLADLIFAVEAGSSGEKVATELALNFTAVLSQGDTLMEIASGASDAAIIDLLMAGAMLGEGTSYPDLTYTVSLSEEFYGIGFRKGSDLAETVNGILSNLYADGAMQTCAQTYGVQESILPQ